MKASAVCVAWLVMIVAPALAQTPQVVMPVYGVSVTATGVTVRVPASACIHKSDFTAAVLRREPLSMVLFAPRHAQTCGAATLGHADLIYRLEELGLKPGEGFILGNPLTAEP